MIITREQKNKIIKSILDEYNLTEYDLDLLENIKIDSDIAEIEISKSDIENFKEDLKKEQKELCEK